MFLVFLHAFLFNTLSLGQAGRLSYDFFGAAACHGMAMNAAVTAAAWTVVASHRHGMELM